MLRIISAARGAKRSIGGLRRPAKLRQSLSLPKRHSRDTRAFKKTIPSTARQSLPDIAAQSLVPQVPVTISDVAQHATTPCSARPAAASRRTLTKLRRAGVSWTISCLGMAGEEQTFLQ